MIVGSPMTKQSDEKWPWSVDFADVLETDAPAETISTAVFTATSLGVPVSTTHTITGAIIGVGSTRRLSAVRWGVAQQIVWAWVLTIPAAAAIAAGAYFLLSIVGLT